MLSLLIESEGVLIFIERVLISQMRLLWSRILFNNKLYKYANPFGIDILHFKISLFGEDLINLKLVSISHPHVSRTIPKSILSPINQYSCHKRAC